MAAALLVAGVAACAAAGSAPAAASAKDAAGSGTLQDGDASEGVVRLGISNFATPNDNEALYIRTVETLRALVAPKRLEVKFYSPDRLAEEADADRLDLVFGSAGFYRRTALETGHRELVSIASNAYPNPNQSDGSAIVVRADRTDLKDILDLRGKVLSANARFTFTGYIVPMGAVAQAAGDADDFFSEQRFHGEGATMADVAHDVLEGRADAGFLRLCMLESLEARGIVPPGALRVIGEKTQPGEACRRSTPLYPGWTVSSTPRASSVFISRVVTALLNQAPVGDGLRWEVATNYKSVDDLYRTLRLGPYEHLREWTVQRFVERFWLPIFVAFCVMAFMTAAAWYYSLLAKRRSEALHRAYARERALERYSRETEEKMNALQKVWVVGQLSSAVAHELRQPLMSIVCLARGLVRFMERGELTAEKTKEVLETLSAQANRANAVVEKVRAYAKSPVGERRPFDLQDAVRNALDALKLSAKHAGVRVTADLAAAPVCGDQTEIELVVLNLLKNGAEAACASPKPAVTVSVRTAGAHAELVVTDNGPEIDAEWLARMTEPFHTSKLGGLGMGLSISRTIVESHAGSLRFERRADGLAAIVDMPLRPAAASTEKAKAGRTDPTDNRGQGTGGANG